MDDSNGMVGGLARRRDGVTLSDDTGTRTGDIVAPVALLILCMAPRVVNLTALPIFFDESVYTRAAEIVGAAPNGSTLLISLHYGALPLFSWQYVTGWPSGFALMRVVANLRRCASHEPRRVLSSIYDPPGDALAVLLGRYRSIALSNVDFTSLGRRPLKAQTGAPIYLIACRPYGQPLRPDLRRLRVVFHASNGDRVGGIDVYEVKRT